MNLLYFVTGNKTNLHAQCYFSILSFLAKGQIDEVFVYTDFPDFYQGLKDKVQVRNLTKEQIIEWKGPADNFFRMKLKLLEDYCKQQNTPKPFIYIDTDTFLYQPLDDIIAKLNEGHALMHRKECLMRKKKHSALRMYKKIRNQNLAGITVTDNHYMWNAGLIALPKDRQAETIGQMLAVCDAINQLGVRHFLVEQCSVSLTLNEYFDLLPAENTVAHYWSTKNEWDPVIADFLLHIHMHNLTLDESIELMKSFDFQKEPTSKVKNDTQIRLIRLIKKWFPDKDKQWIM